MPTFQFSFDADQCLNCGVCVDVCPVHCLDMTRPQRHGPEADFARTDTPNTQTWMTVFPVQIARCTGCMVCTMECPTDVVAIEKVDGPVTFAPVQGPIVPEPAYDPAHWQALSAFTRLTHTDRTLRDPWGGVHKWRPVRRLGNWRVWRTWQTRADFDKTTRSESPISSALEERSNDA
jgi:Pyruvate/2-oxoacid:ferredoxin oxidoreductase delta subunit